jgi:hypothetical protein
MMDTFVARQAASTFSTGSTLSRMRHAPASSSCNAQPAAKTIFNRVTHKLLLGHEDDR